MLRQRARSYSRALKSNLKCNADARLTRAYSRCEGPSKIVKSSAEDGTRPPGWSAPTAAGWCFARVDGTAGWSSEGALVFSVVDSYTLAWWRWGRKIASVSIVRVFSWGRKRLKSLLPGAVEVLERAPQRSFERRTPSSTRSSVDPGEANFSASWPFVRR
jgi:hypothetical protein